MTARISGGVLAPLCSPCDGEDRFRVLPYQEGLRACLDAPIDGFYVCGGTGEGLKRAQSEAANPQGDICWAADESMLKDYAEYFESYVSPEDAKMLDSYKNKSGVSAPAFCDPTVFIVNNDLAGDIEINGFEDLLNPALKGKIAAGDPVNSSSAFQCLVAGLYGVGTVVGDMYGDVYDYHVPGINLGGPCTTFGYLLGKNLHNGTW